MSNLSGKGTLRGALSRGGGTPSDVYWDDILNKPEFAAVATSGSYNDLLDKPPAPNIMTGATAQSNGAAGYTPQPLAGDQNKFLNGAGEWVTPQSSVNYSTDELLIGTYFGKPLYQKSFDGLNVNVNNTSWYNITNIPNGKDLVDIKMWGMFDEYYMLIPCQAHIDSTKNGLLEVIFSGLNNTRTVKRLAVQYTKTTDTVGGE